MEDGCCGWRLELFCRAYSDQLLSNCAFFALFPQAIIYALAHLSLPVEMLVSVGLLGALASVE